MTMELLKDTEQLKALLALQSSELQAFLREQHPADLAELAAALEPGERAAVMRLLEPDTAAQVLGELDLDVQTEVVLALGAETSGGILRAMPGDDVADLLAVVPPAAAGELLGELPADVAADMRELMTYQAHTAGGLMNPEFVAVQVTWTAQQTINELRRLTPDPDGAYYLYVVDDGGRLAGVLSLRELVVAPPGRPIGEIMRQRVVSVRAEDDQEAVARTVSKYNLMAVPVVDADDVLLGIVTADDVIDVLEAEATEDIYRFASASSEEAKAGPHSGVWLAVRSRLPWLVALLFMELLAGHVVDRFSGLIQLLTVLAVFMPVMAGESGNAATQSIAVVVRGLATGEIQPTDLLRVVWREVRVGTIIGIVCGTVLGLVTLGWLGDARLALTVGLALVVTVPMAKTLGAMFPIIIHRMGLDPAVASGPFITTFTDILSMLTYFGMATLMLTR